MHIFQFPSTFAFSSLKNEGGGSVASKLLEMLNKIGTMSWTVSGSLSCGVDVLLVVFGLNFKET